MAVNIGPKIGIDGESEYRKQLNGIIDQAKLLDSEMKKVTSAFDENDNAQENLTQQMEVLQKQMDNQRRKIELLSEYQEKATQKMRDAAKAVEEARKEYGENSIELQKAQREYEDTEKAVRQTTIQINKSETAYNKLAKEMKDTQSQADRLGNDLDDVNAELKEGENAAFDFGDALKAGILSEAITSGVSALKDGVKSLVEDTKEYRTIMGSLEASSERAGYSAEETSAIYKNLYGVLEDSQTSATTTANLQAIGLEQDKLNEIAYASIGAWATYGDSIPIDSLAEAINETIQAGVVTGTFADVLNWAGTNEDEFNQKLENATDSSERANIVLNELSRQGLPELGKAWKESNKDLVEANENTADFEATSAELAEKISPISNAVQKGFNGILDAAVDMLDGVDTDKLVDGIEDVFDVVEDLVKFVIQNGDKILALIGGIASGIAAWKIGSVISNLISKIKEADGVLKLFNTTMAANPAAAIAVSIGLVVTALGLLISSEGDFQSETQKTRAAMEERSDALDELKESYDDVATSAEETASGELAQIEHVESLYTELDRLVGANGRVTEANKARAEFILGQLNEALGTEYTMNGDMIDQYDQMEAGVYDLIEAKKAEILLTASEDKYRQAIENKTEAETLNAQNYIAITEQKQKIDEKYGELLKKYTDEQLHTRIEGISSQEEALRASYVQDKKLLDELQAEYDDSNAQLKQYYSDINSYESASIELSQGNTEKALEILNEQQSGIVQANDLIGQSSIETTQTLGQQYAERLTNMRSYYENYKNGVAGYTEEGLRQIAEDTERARVAFEDGGGKMVDGVLTGIDGKEIDLKTTIETLMGEDVPDWAKTALGDEPKNIGIDIGDGMVSGMNEAQRQVVVAAGNLALAAIEATRSALDSHSPSRVFKDIGQDTGLGFELGMEESMGKAIDTVEHTLRGRIGEISTSITPFSLPESAMDRISNRSYAYGDVHIQVVASPEMDEQLLADAVMNRMQTLYRRREMAI